MKAISRGLSKEEESYDFNKDYIDGFIVEFVFTKQEYEDLQDLSKITPECEHSKYKAWMLVKISIKTLLDKASKVKEV